MLSPALGESWVVVHGGIGGSIKIPLETLSDEALTGLIEAFINREGTDYGHRDYTLAEKRVQVRRQLERGEAVITYDPRTATTSIVPVDPQGRGRERR